MEKYDKVITPKRAWFDLRLKELWQYRDLVLLFTKRHFTLFYKQTILGPAWVIINPLLSSLIYMLVFGNIARLGTDGVPQLLFYLAGTSVWTLFATCVTRGADTFRANAHMFSKVYFPRLTIPASNVLQALLQLGIQMIPVLCLSVYYCVTGSLSPRWALLPVLLPLLVQISLMGMGFGLIISAMTTRYRDLSILVTYGVNLWMYATPVVYPASTLKGTLRTMIWLNPMTTPVELCRAIMFGVGTVDLPHIVYSVIVSAVVILLGMMVFTRV